MSREQFLTKRLAERGAEIERLREDLKFQISLEREACAQVALSIGEDAGAAIAAGIRARNTIDE